MKSLNNNKRRSMKKYFVKSSGEELEFGDMIVLDLTKEMENGKTKYQHLECKFVPELVDMLLENDIIEEKEDPIAEKQGILNFEFEDEKKLEESLGLFDSLLDNLDKINNNLENLTKITAKILTVLNLKDEPKKAKK